jgi:hypothetical protein
MDIGDTIIFGGRRYRICGFDPAGVDVPFVYLRDVETGQSVSLAREVLSSVEGPRQGRSGDFEQTPEAE